MISYDQARQLCKGYVAALNTSEAAFEALFAADAVVVLGERSSSVAELVAATPRGRSGYGGARIEAPEVVLIVKVRHADRLELREHRALLDDAGLITRLSA